MAYETIFHLPFALFLQTRNQPVDIMGDYYMALCHKDWELPNSRIWLAKTDIESCLYLDSYLNR